MLPVISGAVLLVAGLLLVFFPPKMNQFYGYRTPSSMSDEKTWNFAQKYSGKIMALWGLLFILIIAADEFFELDLLNEKRVWLPLLLLAASLASLFILTERGIKKIKKQSN